MVGIDIVKTERIKKINNLEKLFLENEINYFNKYKNNLEIIAGHFAAKEAIMKSFDCCKELCFKDIEIYHNSSGKPFARLYNKAKEEFEEKKYSQINLSISHEDEYAVAVAEIK